MLSHVIIVLTYGIVVLTNSNVVLTRIIVVLTHIIALLTKSIVLLTDSVLWQGNTRLRWLVPLLLSLVFLSSFVALRLSDGWGNTFPVSLQVLGVLQ